MVDNFNLPQMGGGDIIAADEIGGIKFLRNKLVYGNNDEASGGVSATNPLPVIMTGNVANNAVDTGSPVKIGGFANTAIPAPVADGNRVDARFSTDGSMYTHPDTPAGVVVGSAIMVGSVAHDVADDSSNPVKISGIASGPDASNPPLAVDVGDRVQAWYDRSGRKVVQIDLDLGGDVANGDPESSSFVPFFQSLPMKIGGVANLIAPAVLDGSRVDAYFDLTGHKHVVIDTEPLNSMHGDIPGGDRVVGGPERGFFDQSGASSFLQDTGNLLDTGFDTGLVSLILTAELAGEFAFVTGTSLATGAIEILSGTPFVLPPTQYSWFKSVDEGGLTRGTVSITFGPGVRFGGSWTNMTEVTS